jgi:hypothetical protein
MQAVRARTRPGLLTLIGVVSLIWASTRLFGVLFTLFFNSASWAWGVQAGLDGIAIGALLLLGMIGSSGMSVLLGLAGWRTLKDDPASVQLHRIWGWISLALALLGALSSGRSVYSWALLAYSVGVIYVVGRPEVRAWAGEVGFVRAKKGPGPWDELA